MSRFTAAFALSCLLGCGSFACGSSTSRAFDAAAGGAAPGDGKPGAPAGNFSPDGGAAPGDAVIGHLRGTVRAPNGTIPIAGALLYLSKDRPAPTSAKVYCDACVHLAAGQLHALSDATGAYDLPVTVGGKQYLVIQKGGFRAVREITVSAGDVTLNDPTTQLPSKSQPEIGDEVPRMTVVHGAYDDIESSLQKLGIDPSAIDVVQSALIGVAAKDFLTDATRVNDRHIVFLPCGDYTQPAPNTDLSTDPAIQANLKAFVEAGGRLYVTDWHYDFIARTFPGFIDFTGASQTACSGCGHTDYDAAASITDPTLASWMTAQSLGSFTLQRNYTGIDGVNATASTDAVGAPAMVTPKVWVSGSKASGPAKPATVSFEQGCGRVLFSTYHTEPSTLALTPQERALLGVLLEVNVCTASETGVVVN
jgi:hypothetical protein